MHPRQRADRDRLIDAIVAFPTGHDADVLREIRAALEHAIDEAGRDALDTLMARLDDPAADSDALVPIGEDALHPVRIAARIGPAIEADALRARCAGDRRRMMDAIGNAIAELLPAEYRGVYAEAP
jgi:hypothetical protein